MPKIDMQNVSLSRAKRWDILWEILERYDLQSSSVYNNADALIDAYTGANFDIQKVFPEITNANDINTIKLVLIYEMTLYMVFYVFLDLKQDPSDENYDEDSIGNAYSYLSEILKMEDAEAYDVFEDENHEVFVSDGQKNGNVVN